MTKRSIVWISYLIFSLYAVALVFMGFNLVTQIKIGKIQTQEQNNVLKNTIEKAYAKSQDLNDDFTATVKSAINSNERIITAIISKQNTPVFAYPVLPDFISVTASGFPVISNNSSPLIRILTETIPNTDLQITSAAYILEPQTIFYYGKIAFLIILAGTMLSLFFIPVQIQKNQENTVTIDSTEFDDIKTEVEEEAIANAKPVKIKTANSTQSDLADSAPEYEFSVSETELTDNDDKNDQVENKKPVVVNDAEKNQTDSQVPFESTQIQSSEILPDEVLFEKEINSLFVDEGEPQIEQNSIIPEQQTVNEQNSFALVPAIKEKKQLDPMGLFSPKTGLGWESYLETRLDAELIRAASNEQNLALLLLKVTDISHENDFAKKVSEILIKYFNFRDLLFEYGTDSYAAIVQAVSFEQLMLTAETVYAEVTQCAAQESISNPIGIGISIRTQRLITGLRLINEASAALKKSFEKDEAPIIAFKANSEQYRKYVNEELRTTI